MLEQAREIFFPAAYTQSFESPEAEHAFFLRWFGNYAEAFPETFLLALNASGDVTGYLAGCVDSFSPAAGIIANDISYYTPGFCVALKDYPSHFHINVKPGYQGQGIGGQLTARFLQLCADARSPGIHVVTGAESRAVQFYEKQGFTRLSPFPQASSGLAVLVRAIGLEQAGR
ncbi:MAG: GNAT family N-acetyltransferase [Rhodomicrobium sp.]|nr:GNAT family N-acetyltransferase [Rhodomicrobium sp.]